MAISISGISHLATVASYAEFGGVETRCAGVVDFILSVDEDEDVGGGGGGGDDDDDDINIRLMFSKREKKDWQIYFGRGPILRASTTIRLDPTLLDNCRLKPLDISPFCSSSNESSSRRIHIEYKCFQYPTDIIEFVLSTVSMAVYLLYVAPLPPLYLPAAEHRSRRVPFLQTAVFSAAMPDPLPVDGPFVGWRAFSISHVRYLAQRSIRGVCVGRNFVEEKLKAPGGDEPLCVFSRSRRAKTRKKMNAAAVRRRVAYAVAFLCSSHSG
ncbi:hypothetical protein V9T40_001760 [Parthenolecanium corni]|uniref:Uncharacterized protein n=1 Tax=Parthenolecanium corni TaxID=536013 RepID=A0AAN9Y3R9_9HEMI